MPPSVVNADGTVMEPRSSSDEMVVPPVRLPMAMSRPDATISGSR